ncbi:MAG TPA: hypothetical protein VET27_16455 [Mycobacterium sp.]|nr:hypothetical protein [Mycobacterium sp.]
MCQYLPTADEGLVDVVFSWFDKGTLDRERSLANEYLDVVVPRQRPRHLAVTRAERGPHPDRDGG